MEVLYITNAPWGEGGGGTRGVVSGEIGCYGCITLIRALCFYYNQRTVG